MRDEGFVELSECDDEASFLQQLVKRAERLGFPLITALYAVVSEGPRGLLGVSNVPATYSDRSVDPDACARDPVLLRLKRSPLPFAYDQALYVRHGAGDLWEEQAAFGYKTGLAVALHLPTGHDFAIGVDREEPLPADLAKVSRLMDELHILAIHAHAVAHHFWRARRGLRPMDLANATRITARERDLLRWTREGKHAAQLSSLLKLPEPAVRTEMRALLDKLGAVSRHEAVLMATQAGLV